MNPRVAIAAATIVVGGVTLVMNSPGLSMFLRKWEGERNVVYADKLAGGLPTVCAGITKHVTNELLSVGDFWPSDKCDAIEREVVGAEQLNLAKCIRRPITQGTFDALTSFAHNFGVAAACGSRAMGLINRGYVLQGCQALAFAPDGKTPVWSYVSDGRGGKKFVQGLFNRRKEEVQLCLRDVA